MGKSWITRMTNVFQLYHTELKKKKKKNCYVIIIFAKLHYITCIS
jgi:hypothetical protein